MEEELQRRLAINEATFRDVNEAIAKGRWPSADDVVGVFRCECAQLGCTRLIELGTADYERVRSHPRRFILAPGHEIPGAETVVESHGSYNVIEKEDEGGNVAEELDPRA